MLVFLSLGLILVDGAVGVLGQEGASTTITNNSNQAAIGANTQSTGVQKIKESPRAAVLSQRLGGSVSAILLNNQFVVSENGLLRRKRVAVGDLKRLLGYADNDLHLLPSSSYGYPGYELWFADVRCIIEVAEQHKSIHDEATLVNVGINTNLTAIGRNPGRVSK